MQTQHNPGEKLVCFCWPRALHVNQSYVSGLRVNGKDIPNKKRTRKRKQQKTRLYLPYGKVV